jgi:hypothetical protein
MRDKERIKLIVVAASGRNKMYTDDDTVLESSRYEYNICRYVPI